MDETNEGPSIQVDVQATADGLIGLIHQQLLMDDTNEGLPIPDHVQTTVDERDR